MKLNGYEEIDPIDGVMDVELSSWKVFHSYVVDEMLQYSHFVWRGQRDSEWGLQSSIDRLVETNPRKKLTKRLLETHLEKFKVATRGRRGANPPREISEDEWWALGQHHGLATPLLDWTRSPFVALYFAFEKSESPKSGVRAVWALSGAASLNSKLKENHSDLESSVLQLIRPHQDENARLVSQGGLFTRAPLGQTVEDWIRKHASFGEEGAAHLIRILIPDYAREECLRALNMMNINHMTLFPDLYGASQHCNKTFSILNYHC